MCMHPAVAKLVRLKRARDDSGGSEGNLVSLATPYPSQLQV